jgi:hypothetical protein
MSHLRRLWTGILTRNKNDESGTDSRIALIIEGTQLTLPDDPVQADQERGQANLYEIGVAANNIVPEDLTDSSIRLAILGNNAWRPEHFVVWGERFTGGAIVPLAIETDISAELSTDPDEGNVSLPLRLVGFGSATRVINRLLVMMTTASSDDAGTDNGITLRVTTSGGTEVVDFDFPETPQEEQERGQANLYLVPVGSGFTKASLAANSIRLSISGTDAWLPGSLFIFGLDDAAGRPEFLVPLVNLRTWPFGLMSTDSNEGRSSVTLPLLP